MGIARKGAVDLQKWLSDRGVIGSLPNRDTDFPRMTNAAEFRYGPC
jgi:hypothetical protein